MGKKLYVGNMSYDMDSSSLQELFSAHGTVQSAEIISDRETGRGGTQVAGWNRALLRGDRYRAGLAYHARNYQIFRIHEFFYLPSR